MAVYAASVVENGQEFITQTNRKNPVIPRQIRVNHAKTLSPNVRNITGTSTAMLIVKNQSSGYLDKVGSHRSEKKIWWE